MRILIFSNLFPRADQPNRGIYCRHLCEALVASGHAVRVMAPRSWLDRGYVPYPRNVLPQAPRICVEHPVFYYPPKILRHAYHHFLWLSVGRRLRRLMSDFSPDVLLSGWAHPDGAVAVRAARKFGLPVVIMVAGSDALVIPKTDPRRGRRIAETLAAADAVITVSRQLLDRVTEMGIDPSKVHIKFHGVDPIFCPGDRQISRQRLKLNDLQCPMLLYVGNLVPVKGLDVLLDACAMLRDRQDFRLYLIGSGPCRVSLERQARVAGLSGRVYFRGAVMQRELPDWYRAADLTVMASHSEGIPNALHESLACGTPFAATDVGGIREIADPLTCRLAPAANARALAESIVEALAVSPARTPLRRAATWGEYAENLVEIIRGIRGTVAVREIADEPALRACEAKEDIRESATAAGVPA